MEEHENVGAHNFTKFTVGFNGILPAFQTYWSAEPPTRFVSNNHCPWEQTPHSWFWEGEGVVPVPWRAFGHLHIDFYQIRYSDRHH